MSIMRYIIIGILTLIAIGSAYGQRNRIELWQLKYAQGAGYVPYSKSNGEYEATALSSLITGVSIDDAFVLNDSLYFVFSDGDTLNAGYLPLSATIIDSLYMQGDSLVVTQDTVLNKVDLSQFRQTLSISNDTLFISGGNSVILPASGGGGTDTSGYNNYFNLSSQTLSIGDANDTLTVTLPIVGINAGTGITTNAVNGVVTITNTAPDQVVSITGGGINAVSGSYPNFTITGTEVDGSVTNEGRLGVGAGGANTATITTNTSGSNAVTFAGGTGISLTESTSTNGGTITITNSAPDQTVSITGSTGITVGGSYPNFSLSVADQSATNELQNLNLSGQTLSISSGNNVTLPVIGITAGTGISTSTTSGNVTITNALPEATTARNVNATGEGVLRAEVGNELQFKKLIAGSNVTLTSADSTITIASSGGGGGVDTATFLQQDSILIYSVAGVEFGRDTIRTDKTVTITGAGINSVSGTYPNFTITGTEVDGSVTNEGRLGVGAGGANTSTLTTNTSGSNAVTFAGGTGISLTESTSSNGGTITITNNAADQTVVLTAGTGISTSGTYPNFTIANTSPDQTVTISGTGITVGGTYPSFTLTAADTSATNELQTLSISNDTLSISGGNSVVLPASGGGTDTSGYNTYFNLTDQTLSIGDYNDTLTATLPIVGINAGTGITTNSVNGVVTITNSAPDQVVTITGAGINSVSGSYPSYVITASEVDGSITNEGILGVGAGGANTSLITSNTSTATGVTISGGTGIGVSESTSTNGGTITITNNAADQTVVLNAGTGISTSGTYPNFTITNSAPDQVVTLAGTGITTISGSYPSFTINSTEVDGSTTNELQTLSRNQDTIFISNGNYVILPAASGIDSIFQSGDTVYIVAAGDTSFFVIPPAVGDNWGSQVVISDTTLVGDGTSGNPLGVDTTQIATHYYISEGFTTKYIDFDTLYANNYQEGRMKWNVDENSVEIGLSPNLSGTTLMDDFWYVKNQSGNSIAAGSVVYASGTLGTSGRILVTPYIANGTIDAKYVLGVVAETIPDGADGYVITKGKLKGINTSAWPDGTVLWASTANAGNLTDTVPQAPNFRLPVAFVVHSASNGILAVRITTGSDLYEDHRVQVGSPTDGQLLRYDSTDQRWENWTPNYALQDTSGRNNYLALSNDTLYVGDDNDTLNVLLPYYPNTNPNGYISSFTDTSGYNNYFNLSSQTLSIGDANDTLAVTLPIVGVSAGTGITVNTTSGVATVTNAAPDQTVVLTAGTGISTSGTYPNFTIANTSPDQTVTISGTGITVGGTYPSFTLTAADTSATNELQTLSISNDTLSISGGNSVVLPASGGGGGDTLNYLAISNDTLFVGDTNDTLSVKLTNASVLQIVDITVTTDTVTTSDLGKLLRCNNAGAITLRIDTNANQPLPIGAVITVEQVGAGVVTITPISGVTINPTARKTWGQYSVIQLIKVGTDTWNVVGGSS